MPIQFDPELNNEYEFPDGTPPEEAQRAMNQVRQVAQAQAVLGPLGQAANQMMGGGNQHPMGAPPSPETAFAMGPEWYQQEMAQREGARQHQVESQQQQQYMQQQQQQHQAQMGMEQRRLTQDERKMIEDRQQAAKDRQLQIKAMREEQKAEEAQREFEREQAERQREWNAAQPVTLSQGAQMVDPQTGEVIHQAPYRPLRSAGGAGGMQQSMEFPRPLDLSQEELAMLPMRKDRMEQMMQYTGLMSQTERDMLADSMDQFAATNPDDPFAQRWMQTREIGQQRQREAESPFSAARQQQGERREDLDVTQRQQGQGQPPPDPAAAYPDAEELAAQVRDNGLDEAQQQEFIRLQRKRMRQGLTESEQEQLDRLHQIRGTAAPITESIPNAWSTVRRWTGEAGQFVENLLRRGFSAQEAEQQARQRYGRHPGIYTE